MKKLVLASLISIALFGAKLGDFAPKGDRKDIIIKKVDSIKKELKPMLNKTISKHSIDVCSKDIQKTFDKINQKYKNSGIFFERVSRKPRTKKAHYRKVDFGMLAHRKMVIVEKYFETKKLKNCKYPKKNFILRLRDKKGLDYFMVYEPIFAKKSCLECHGQKIKRKRFRNLRKLYPNDKSIGFKKGELMGFLVARVSPLAYKIKK